MSAAALCAVFYVAVQNPDGQLFDEHAMHSLYGAHNSSRTIFSWLGLITAGTSLAALAVCVLIALVQRRWSRAASALVVVAGANLTTQVLKHSLLARPDHGWGSLNSLPSGHTTVIMSLVLAALLVVPAVVYPIVCFFGGLAVVLITGSMVTASWHRPSDVLAAILVSLLWATATFACIPDAEPRQSRIHRVRPLTAVAPAFTGAALGGVCLAVIGVRPLKGWPGLPEALLVLSIIIIAVTVTIGGYARILTHKYLAARARL